MSDAILHPKTLRQRDMVLFTVSAILLLETLAGAASAGVSSVFWWCFLGAVFFIPFALISAEMGCAYPEQGGIYAWIRDAFGGRWASRATWCYWVNTAVWIPSIFIMFAGVFAQMFVPDLALGWQIALGIALTWLAVGVNVITLDAGKWVPNLGAIIKVIIFLAIIGGAFVHIQANGMANPITVASLTPTWGEGLQYLPLLIYGMLGFELVSAGSEEMRDPATDVPRAILYSGAIIISLYILGTVAVLAAVPIADIDLVEGLLDTLALFFGGSAAGDTLVTLMGVGALYVFFANGVTWALGCNRAAAEAALEGELPRAFAVESSTRGTPVGAAVLMGLVSTTVLLLYGLQSGSASDLFWDLFAFSAVIFLLPYVGMSLAFMRMRLIDAEHPRPYRVPGNHHTAMGFGAVCAIILLLAVVLFIYSPGDGLQLPVLIGASVTLAIGEIVIRFAENHRRR
jgi:amino acid transporter